MRGHNGLPMGLMAGNIMNQRFGEKPYEDALQKYTQLRQMNQNAEYQRQMIANTQNQQKINQANQEENAKERASNLAETHRHNVATEENASNKEDSTDKKQNQKIQDATDQRDGLLANLDELQSTLKGISSGPIVGRLGQLGANIGVGPNKDAITKFNTLITGMKLQYGKDFSGRYNNQEGEEIEKKLLPIINLPPDQQKSALDGARTLIMNKFYQVKNAPGSSPTVQGGSQQYSDEDRARARQILEERRKSKLMAGAQ
jgi:hypothetical protein